MTIFSNGKATFAERLSSVEAMFQTAHNQASALNAEMTAVYAAYSKEVISK